MVGRQVPLTQVIMGWGRFARPYIFGGVLSFINLNLEFNKEIQRKNLSRVFFFFMPQWIISGSPILLGERYLRTRRTVINLGCVIAFCAYEVGVVNIYGGQKFSVRFRS